jgi:hypothetical protein
MKFVNNHNVILFNLISSRYDTPSDSSDSDVVHSRRSTRTRGSRKSSLVPSAAAGAASASAEAASTPLPAQSSELVGEPSEHRGLVIDVGSAAALNAANNQLDLTPKHQVGLFILAKTCRI